jgi:hypothetical protein
LVGIIAESAISDRGYEFLYGGARDVLSISSRGKLIDAIVSRDYPQIEKLRNL